MSLIKYEKEELGFSIKEMSRMQWMIYMTKNEK